MRTVNSKERFVLDVDDFPLWFKDETARGRARVFYDEDGEIKNVKIISATKTYTALPGDTIVKLKSGMVVIKAEDAKKYGVKETGVTKEEDKRNV